MKLHQTADGFSIQFGPDALLRHSVEHPMLFLGIGRENIRMYRGNFDIKDNLEEKIPLRAFELREDENGWTAIFRNHDEKLSYTLTFRPDGDLLRVQGRCSDIRYNRIWLRIPARKDEFVYGGGEQFSCLNLRGKKFPIWCREQGVGRNKKTLTTALADLYGSAGGDYHTTFFPQPTFISSRHYFCHLENYDYSELNFESGDFHEIHVWNTAVELALRSAESYAGLLYGLGGLLGRQQMLPEWAYRGAWLGVQGGTEICREKLRKMLGRGAKISALWAQDWEGVRMTSFGKRLQWDWRWDETLYPGLPEQIREWNKSGVRFLGYINPYLAQGGQLFQAAAEKRYLVLNGRDEIDLVDCGEFNCGIVDFTNPEAFSWYKDVIKRNLIGIGFSGWMADFGEYLPADCRLYSGESALTLHNKWPALWAKANYEALEETGNAGKIIPFMRSGAAGSQKYSALMWAGDQNVDWSLDDGLASVITAALSAGMSGCGLHTSDIGGYTTLYRMHRTKELFLRWTEFCMFTPVMRTHEGNRPNDNWQFDSDGETMEHFAWATRIHALLFPYLRALDQINHERSLPVMRPLFLQYEDDVRAHETMYEYLLGPDLLVAPVYLEGETSRELYLPRDSWVSLWDGIPYPGGSVSVGAPIGRPPEFYRAKSGFAGLFRQIAEEGPFSGASSGG
jgi:alpha-glucosidase